MAKIRQFEIVHNIEDDKIGTVVDRLSVQFTVEYDDGSFGFLMHAHEGDVWRVVEQPHNTKIGQ